MGCHFLFQGIFPTQGLNPGCTAGRFFTDWATREAQVLIKSEPWWIQPIPGHLGWAGPLLSSRHGINGTQLCPQGTRVSSWRFLCPQHCCLWHPSQLPPPTSFKIFLIRTIFKVFIVFVTMLLLFCSFDFFGPKACGILAPDQRLNPHPLHWKAKSTTGPPGKSLSCPSDAELLFLCR